MVEIPSPRRTDFDRDAYCLTEYGVMLASLAVSNDIDIGSMPETDRRLLLLLLEIDVWTELHGDLPRTLANMLSMNTEKPAVTEKEMLATLNRLERQALVYVHEEAASETEAFIGAVRLSPAGTIIAFAIDKRDLVHGL